MKKICNRNKLLFILITVLFFFSSCDNLTLDRSGYFYNHLKDEFSITYKFYEYPDLSSNHIDKDFVLGKTVTDASFPVYEHEDSFLVGWQYLTSSGSTSSSLPANFFVNQKNYINAIRVGITSENLYAVWKTKCTVTFETNSDIQIAPAVVPEGDCISEPYVEYKHNKKIFRGWYTDSNLTTLFDFTQPIESDITLYAKWVEYVLYNYHKNDGTAQVSSWEYLVEQEEIEIPICPGGIREGYGFLGWAETPDGDLVYYAGDRINNPTEDKDLYAIWSQDIITITYIDPLNTYSNITVKYARGCHINVGTVLSEDGWWYDHLANRWFTEEDGKELAGYSETLVTDLDDLIYEKWGWYYLRNEDGSPKLDSNGSPIWSNYITANSDMTFYVYNRDVTFQVSFRYLDEDGRLCWFGNDRTVLWNHTIEIPDSVPFVNGYTFENWYLVQEMNGSYIFNSTPFDFSTALNNETFRNTKFIILMAKFTENDSGSINTTISFHESPDSDNLNVITEYLLDSIQFTASSGYASYTWYLNGVEQNILNNQTVATFDTSSWVSGCYDITLIVYDSDKDEYYSWGGQVFK